MGTLLLGIASQYYFVKYFSYISSKSSRCPKLDGYAIPNFGVRVDHEVAKMIHYDWSSVVVVWYSGVVECSSGEVEWSSGVVEWSSGAMEWSSGAVE